MPVIAWHNGYAQDNELTWVHWDQVDQPLIEFTAALARLRRQHPTFRRSRFFDGRPVRREEGAPLPDIVWLRPDGSAMQPEDWDSGFGRAVGVFLNGDGIRERDRRGEDISDGHFFVLFNAGDEQVDFAVPSDEYSDQWEVLVDTSGELVGAEPLEGGQSLGVRPKSLVVLGEYTEPEAEVDHSVAASLATYANPVETMPAHAPTVEVPGR